MLIQSRKDHEIAIHFYNLDTLIKWVCEHSFHRTSSKLSITIGISYNFNPATVLTFQTMQDRIL